MKKLMVFAMAAMVAFASCTKTELVDNSAPTPISFKAVTGSMTKAPEESCSEDLGVFAFITDDKSDYFGNSAFTKDLTNNDGTWIGGKFWPIESKLDFVVYYPYQDEKENSVEATHDASSGKVSLEVVIPDNSTKQTDYMYSNTYITNKGKNSQGMSVVLNHALSLISIEFDLPDDSGITVSNVTLDNTYQSGTYNVSYAMSTVDGNVVWTPDITWSSWGSKTATIKVIDDDILVVPNADADEGDQLVVPDISFTYTMPGCKPQKYTSSLKDISTWAPGIKYVYTISITPEQIRFTPSVSTWGTDNNFDSDIDIK